MDIDYQHEFSGIVSKNTKLDDITLDYEGTYEEFEDSADYIRLGAIQAEVIA